jgi:DNA-binding NarL/FixJ family response regulator
MKRILFVDDEPLVLRGLRNLLHAERSRWEMVFAVGGEAALEELAKARFDVIVSDLRMPGMDGLTLLRCVQADYPHVARIVLSGYAHPATLEAARAVARAVLGKPCDPQMLRTAIEAA